MRRLRRLIFALIILGLIAVATLFTVNTISFSSKQINVEAIEPLKISYEAVARLAAAVKYPTVSLEESIDTAAFRGLDTFFWKSFPLVDSMLERETIGGFSYILKWPGQNARLAPILLMAHLDVVPVEDAGSRWTVKPFSGMVKDEFIWGRGTLDDKVSACGILEAVELLLEVDYAPQRTVFIAFGHDEEVGGGNGAGMIAQAFKKRNITFDYILDEGSLIVENALSGLDEPLALIGVAEKGYATLDLSVNLPEGGHASMPPKGSAINILGNALVKLENNPSPAKIEGAVKDMFEYAGPEMGLFQKVVFANLQWTETLVKLQMAAAPSSNAMLRSTTAPTIIHSGFKENVLPTKAIAKLNCRILPGESVKEVMNYVFKTIDDNRVVVSLGNGSQASEPPPVSDQNTFGYSVIQTTIRQVFPEAVVAPALVVGTTDSRHFQDLSPNIYRFLPAQVSKDDLKRFHGVDERIGVKAYEQVIRFYRQLILNSGK
ncbi:MAG: M20/M25/M40 family metallo-hydrolase [Lewinellaceae bacterium]|nr:M20 family peptidase [Saprospiraceae bacterium]MCB9337140.1 M20/M25/M40 family metallo-hydrolase [Lewinellaceae bacterium]